MGQLNTIKVSFIGIVFTLVLGTVVGISRLSSNWLVSKLAGGYIEVMQNIPVLLTIPLDMNIAGLYSKGVPLVEGIPDYKNSFIKLYEKIGETVNERSSNPQR